MGREIEEIDPLLFSLLKSIRDQGSLQSAARTTGISYRHAWGLIRHWTGRISKPIVTMEKGRGATLTEIGEKLLWAEQMISNRLTPDMNSIANELNSEFNNLIKARHKSSMLRIYASHGLGIAHLQILCAESPVFDLDFHFRGSLESLRELANARCDIAGFHFPSGELSARLAPLYQQWTDPEKHMLLHVSTRQQGLMTQKNNPHKITGLKSLTKRAVRFINRQPESGTRTIFDEMLRQEGINKNSINGYKEEEFTHVAVAAMVASGSVDAGFGIKAAAARFDLHFIPIIRENYVLAVDKTLSKKIIAEMTKILKSRKYKSKVSTLPGYDVKHAGKEITFDELFRGH